MTQGQIAIALGVKENTVYRWESDRAPISKTVELALKQIEAEKAGKTLPDIDNLHPMIKE